MRQTQPPPAEVNALLALYNGRRYAELESQARSLVDHYPYFGFGWKLLGGALQMQGKNALPAFNKTAELMPGEADAHYNLGVAQKSSGQLEAAAASYRRAVALKPDYAEAHSNLGNTLKDLGRLDEAVASYRRALKIKPDSADAHNNLGTVLKELGQLDKAIASYRRAVALKPDFALAYYNLGNAQKELVQLDAAVTSYRRAVEIKPDFADAHNNLGTTLKDLGQFDAALASYRRVLELKPGFAEAHNNLGITLKGLGQLDAALSSYRKAVEIEPDFANAHYNLGNVLKDLGQLASAVDSYRRAVELKPDFADAHNNLCIALKELGQFDAALASCRRVLELKPDSAEAHNNLGVVLQACGQLEDAEVSYRRAVELKLDYAGAHYNLGNLLKELGKLEDAAMCYKTCLEIDPEDQLGVRLLNASLGFDPIPARASASHLDNLYAERSLTWDKNALIRDENAGYYGANLVAQALQQWLPKSGEVHILDAGCGTGLVGLLIRDLAYQLDGIDMSSSMLKKAREKNIYDHVYQVDLETFMANNPEKYEAITCAATLIHFGDLTSVFCAAATCLRNQGLFVFTLFQNDREKGSKEVVVAQLPAYSKGGCYAHSKEYVIRLAEAAGFIVEMLRTEIHEYHVAEPVMGFIVVLRRCAVMTHD